MQHKENKIVQTTACFIMGSIEKTKQKLSERFLSLHFVCFCHFVTKEQRRKKKKDRGCCMT